MKRLSLPIDQMRDHYKVVIVGSGYGGVIVASRVARAGQDVCVLEHGRELHPGEYPNSAPTGLRENPDQRAMGVQQATPTGAGLKVGLEMPPTGGVTLSDGRRRR